MGVHSGKFAVLDGVSTVRNWSINDQMAMHEYVASNTLFGTGRVNGVHEWGGSFGIYGYEPSVLPGDFFSFLGYTAPSNDTTGAGVRYSGSAVSENLKISWGWQGADIISATSDFKGHLQLLHGSGIERYDVAVPTVPSVIGTKITYSSDGVTFTEWENLLSAELTLSAKLLEYVTSSTVFEGDNGLEMWKGQKVGSKDWNASVTVLDNVREGVPQQGQSLIFRFYVSPTVYFELKWGKVQEFTGINADRETGAIYQYTVPIAMDGFDPEAVSYDASVGHVLMPSGTQWWPGEQPGTGSGD